MKRLVLLFSVLLLPLVGGCAHTNYYNLPQNTVAEKVKVLGVVPIIVDTDSDIQLPQREDLINLLVTMNHTYERSLLRLIKETDSFYTVTMLDVDPKAVYSSLAQRRERRDDASIQYNKYFWQEGPLADFVRTHNLDAVMFVIISGITRPEKISSSHLLDYLTTDYNYLIMTAQILDPKGNLLWEYPNFREQFPSYAPLINLQYPDFDEARNNMSRKVDVKFKTLEGIRRALEKRRLDWLRRETPDVDLYLTQFEAMGSLLKIEREQKPAVTAQPAAQTEPAEIRK